MSETASLRQPETEAIAQLRATVGPEHVLLGAPDLEFYSQDVHHAATPPLAVVRPGTAEEIAAVVGIAAEQGLVLVPRGGGMSYTRGYLADRRDAVVVDMGRMNRILDINVDDGWVTVECGATWKELHDALAPLGVRTPFWGPLSGLRSTIGGAISQGALFLGSGTHGAVGETVLGLDVVLGDGRIVRVGAHANARGTPFFRQFGPDLSAMFTHDCGALGIKVRATLRLVRIPAELRHLSCNVPDARRLFALMADIAREQLASEMFGFDPGMQKVRMKRVSMAEDAKALGQVVKAAGGGLKGLAEGAKVVLGGRGFLDEAQFSLHVSIEGRDAEEADARLARVRQLLGDRGSEVAATIPKVMRANPFAEVNSMLGPSGERWVPVHGSVPLSAAARMYEALEAVQARHRQARERHAIDHGYLVCGVGDRAILIEPVMYWPDCRQAFHERVIDSQYLAKLPSYEENLAAREAVDRLRADLARCFMEHGAVSFQIGRFYLYQEGLDPAAAALLEAVKSLVDPQRILNPGSLGLRR
jgi:FAD/FMN-containing dehydrogenase